ncbi:GPW/gp25 family protein [Persicimonas caeni]|uniref:GPW/gp25 family protein n=1 Tax=Persicimonas caeni TaxID=2292766 RepID=A0A4Y6Q360_PERCE|nr:GPW/gp25 family protein [Persicimonas caeni]QED36130.1 GPW/gp25 family protein [Persicimonas caeni]
MLGTGWRFPVDVGGRGGFRLAKGADAIAQSIWLIVSTSPGERMMRPEFGCAIHDFVFAPNNAGTRAAIAHHVQEALVRWEPRIDVIDVRATSDAERPNLLRVEIDYRVRANNAVHNLVYPFFLQE